MAGSVLPFIKQQFLTNAGLPAVGHLVFSYEAGTSTPSPLYSDAALTTPHTQPLVLDAAGRATIFCDNISYKISLAAPGDTVPTSPLWTVDNIPGAGAGNFPWTRIVASGIVHSATLTDKIGIGTAAPTKLFSVAERFTIDSNGRALSNAVATYDLGGNTMATSLALDPNGSAGDAGYGGTISPTSGMNTRLISMSGTLGAIAPAALTEFAGIDFNFKNTGTSLNAAMRGIIGQVRITNAGHGRTAYFRGAADTGATGFFTSILAAVEAAAAQTTGAAVGTLIYSDGAANKAYGLQLGNDSGKGFNVGVVFGDDFEAGAAAVRLRQAATHGKVAWGATFSPYLESSSADQLIIGAATMANVKVGIGKAPQSFLHVLGTGGSVAAFPTITNADTLVLEGTTAAGMGIVTGAAATGWINFYGSGDSLLDGSISYNRSTRVMDFYAAQTKRMSIIATGSILTAVAGALATNATGGFLYIPTCPGVPTGTPVAHTGMAPLVIDSTNNNLYAYIGGAWRDCTV